MRRKRKQVKRWTAVFLTAACMMGATLLAYAEVPSGPASDMELAAGELRGSGPAAGGGSEAGQAPETENQEGQSQTAEGAITVQPAQPDDTAQPEPPESTEQAEAVQEEPPLQTEGLVFSNGRYLDPDGPMIALTFDDGPYAPVGNRIMDALEQYNGRATFFVVGSRVAAYQAEIQRMHNNGHEIGNHTYSHQYLDKVGAGQIQSQVELCNQAVAAVTGEAPKLVRLPGGRKNSTVMANVHYPIIMWNVDTLDWKTRNAAKTIQTVLSRAKDGDIILMHELYNASGDAAVTLIPALAGQGFQLVTVSELARFRGGLANGTLYFSFGR